MRCGDTHCYGRHILVHRPAKQLSMPQHYITWDSNLAHQLMQNTQADGFLSIRGHPYPFRQDGVARPDRRCPPKLLILAMVPAAPIDSDRELPALSFCAALASSAATASSTSCAI